MSTALKGPEALIDERLITALSHDTREHALMVFNERPASTKEIAAELELSVSAVWYHVKKLEELGCIKEVDSKRRRGATERFFVATTDFFFDAEAWRTVPKKDRMAVTMRILRLISGDLNEALRADTVDATDHHLSRTTADLDQAGWVETNELLRVTLDELLAIRRRNAERLAKSDEQPTRVSVSMMQFELPPRSDA